MVLHYSVKELFCQLRKCSKSEKPHVSPEMLYLMVELCFVDKIQISGSELNQSIYWSVRSNDGAGMTSQKREIVEISWVGKETWAGAGGYRERYCVSSSLLIFSLLSDQY